MRRRLRQQRGQAAVEAAITLPLALFMVLGTLQLFLMLQARLMAEHAAFRAVRTGSLSQGSCTRMLHASIATLLPTFTRADQPARLASAFGARRGNRYDPALDSGHDREIVWLIRESPRGGALAHADDRFFDDPDQRLVRLEVRLIYWYPMRIPFANWVIARIALASWGLAATGGNDPLMPVRKGADWSGDGPPDGLPSNVLTAFRNRTNSPAGTYVFPIQATAAMRMMTPARRAFFSPQNCR